MGTYGQPAGDGRSPCAHSHLPASSKDSQAYGEVLSSVVFFQDLSIESAFPYDRSKPACGRYNIRAFSVEQTKSK